jgi:hypothetical protein
LAADIPFPARENLISFFEKNRIQLDDTKERNMPDADLFLLRFVRLHGILFTRTSTEKFDSVFAQCLKKFEPVVMSGSVDRLALLKMIACNMFIVHDARPVGNIVTSLTLLSSYAISLALDFSVAIIRCALQSGAKLSELLPSIAVLLDWIRDQNWILKIQSQSTECFWDTCSALFGRVSDMPIAPTASATDITREMVGVSQASFMQIKLANLFDSLNEP